MDIKTLTRTSYVLFVPLTEAGKTWLMESPHTTGYRWFGQALRVTRSRAPEIIEAATTAGKLDVR